ncbi:hypothetical protein A2446_05280 [Candidatus Roizmanbacteria bacterium RIFOXYC2_FULL_38_9]|nr:MAG: hypothetical protein A2446_05280 [Candidatus Roizmanbacteria bacterium RIFOXYC2_FULL_38_9]
MLLHGLTNSHIDCPLISESAELFHSKGFPTFRFDYYGSGKSDGEFKDKTWKVMVKNTKDVLKYAKTKLNYSKIGIWGRSLGAILGATISDDPSIIASVFLSMTIHTNLSFSRFFSKEKLVSLPIKGTAVVKGEPILDKRFYDETEYIDRLQEKHLSKARNILIVQGTKDKTVYDQTWAKEIYDIVNKSKKLIYIKGADHAYTNHEVRVIREGLKWFDKCSNNLT